MGMEQRASLGGRLRGLREAAGLSQEELARRSGLSVEAISAIERGKRKRPYPHTLRALADALGFSEAERAAFTSGSLTPAVAGEVSPASAAPLAAVPVPLVDLVGREAEVTALSRMLLQRNADAARLITLTGPGGAGKTSLSLAVAAEVREAEDTFADGVTFVPLAQTTDPALVLDEVSHHLGLKETAGSSPRDTLHAGLGDKRMLLVLDNFEQVVDAAREVSELLGASPGLVVLVTSREALRVRGERQFPVAPLPVPDLADLPGPEEVEQAASAELFVRRAREVNPPFELTRANAAAVAAICRRLDGLPLAIELAAARAKLLTPTAILGRLDEALPLLSGGPRDLPERQQTMRQAVAWSYDLLDEQEKTAFQNLSVFSGGFTLEAAEVVCKEDGATLEILSSLLDKSLVVTDASTGAGSADEPRFGMLETIRAYGLERLAEGGREELVQEQHARFYTGLAERAEPDLRGGPIREAWFGTLESEHDNLRAALRWYPGARRARKLRKR